MWFWKCSARVQWAIADRVSGSIKSRTHFFLKNTYKYDYITLLLKCLYKINLAWVKTCFRKINPSHFLVLHYVWIFIPLCRAGLVLLSTFVLTHAYVYRDGSTLEKSTRSRHVRTRLPVAWAFTMLSCDVDSFINVVSALALAYFLFVLLLFWIEIHKPLPHNRQWSILPKCVYQAPGTGIVPHVTPV